jgi:RNA polymerase subunit RPABC4/transcription elongation factor Spt4
MKANRDKKIPTRICPICHIQFTAHPALSRTDNRTPICPDCGTKQALTAFIRTLPDPERAP